MTGKCARHDGHSQQSRLAASGEPRAAKINAKTYRARSTKSHPGILKPAGTVLWVGSSALIGVGVCVSYNNISLKIYSKIKPLTWDQGNAPPLSDFRTLGQWFALTSIRPSLFRSLPLPFFSCFLGTKQYHQGRLKVQLLSIALVLPPFPTSADWFK